MSKQKEKRSWLNNLSQEEKFRQKIALRQCLWGYFTTVNKGEPLTQAERELVYAEFEANAEFAEEAFTKVVEGKSSNSDLVSVLRDEAMEILNARSLKALRKLWDKFEAGDYSDEQRSYIRKLYKKRKARLKAEAN